VCLTTGHGKAKVRYRSNYRTCTGPIPEQFRVSKTVERKSGLRGLGGSDLD
jgi:hypothetical protein